jgi:nucleotide-binding universal stress UspA family protein
MKGKKRILYPTDFSPAADAAFAYALESARREGAAMVLLHVIEPESPLADELAVALSGPGRDAVEAGARMGFDDFLARAKAVNVEASDLLREGHAADEIVAAAASEHADVIIMGTHGRTGLRRLMLGSVAERVVATAHCPVITVRMSPPLV